MKFGTSYYPELTPEDEWRRDLGKQPRPAWVAPFVGVATGERR